MSQETIDNVFKDVTEVETLLLTGGEPLLALKQIKEILNVIHNNKIKINSILLITNCTVLNDDILNALNDLSNDSKLNVKLSYDTFHYLELCRLNLLDKRTENAEILKEKFNASDYFDYSKAPKNSKELIYPIGKAANLTLKRLDEINIVKNTNYDFNYYELVPYTFYDTCYNEEDNEIEGIVSVDVNGNVVSYSLPFDEEDNEALTYDSNINKNGLLNACLNYINNKNQDDFKNETLKVYKKIKNA